MWRTNSKNQKINDTVVKREIISTQDGSSSLYVSDMGETYHSVYGAVQEALHVYIKNGFLLSLKSEISVLEMGFGTGLNFLLTLNEAQNENIKLNYVGVEGYPLESVEWNALNYSGYSLEQGIRFHEIHELSWNEKHQISENIQLTKVHTLFQNFVTNERFDVIYYDAFGYDFQPELWTQALFENMYAALNENGVLVTYACKGIIKQNLRSSNFKVKRVPGPPGKREMIIAYKKS